MKCSKVRNNLIFLIEKDLSPDLEKELSQHLESCNECSVLFKEISETYSNLNIPEEIETEAFFADGIINKICEPSEKIADNSSLLDMLLLNYFKRVALSGIAIIAFVIIFFYVTEGSFLFNFLADSDYFSSEKASTIFLDNNNYNNE